jgi:hypothetical protein
MKNLNFLKINLICMWIFIFMLLAGSFYSVNMTMVMQGQIDLLRQLVVGMDYQSPSCENNCGN